MKLKKIYYLSGTHWDREWYKPFQGFRYMLMNVLDEVIEVLEKTPEFGLYMLDGQTAVLDDYVEIAPQMRSRLEKLIADGRIAVGPWYTMPDEFIPSGESLIRNLLLGHQKAKEYAAPDVMKYGYMCDIFGHIAQTPQIFAGFGIHGALIQRGCNQETCPPHFRWRSPDGTECIVYRTPEDFGYGAFYHYATEPYTQGWNPSKDDLVERAIREIDREAASLNVPYLVLDDALDHQRITKLAPWLAQKLSEHYQCPVVFTTMDDLVKELQPYKEELPVKSGELAETSKIAKGTNILLTYTLSSRYDIKKSNDLTQNLWEKWAEPLSAIHAVDGRAIRPRYRDVAYRYLIRNHAHDSICGCSVEEVHRDMAYRFHQASTIAEEVIDDCLRQDAASFQGGDKMVIRLFNPLPYSRRETIKTRICFEKNFASKFSEGEREYEWKPSFLICDKDGREVPYTLCTVRHNRINKTPTQYTVDYADVCFTADLTATGYSDYMVIPADSACRMRYIGEMTVAPLTAENRFIRLTIQNDGTVNLTDKRTGRSFRDLLSYADDGEIGDGWMHIRPAADRILYSTGSPCIIEKLYDGPAEVAFRITTELKLPAKMQYDGDSIDRCEKVITVPIRTTLRLGADNAFVDVETEIDNTAMDHRLKVCLPTDVEGDIYHAGQSFTMLTRPVGGDVSTGSWKEPQYGDRNFNGIAAKRDEKGEGIAFLSAYGLHEVMAMADERHTLAVTLYRSFAKTVGTNDYDQTDGELLGKLEFAYRLMPLTSDNTEADMVRCRDALQAGIRCYTVFAPDTYRSIDSRPFVELKGDHLAMSILKVPEDLEADTVILRLVNYSDTAVEGSITTSLPLLHAYRTNMLETPELEYAFEGCVLPLSLAPRKILTLRLTFMRN